MREKEPEDEREDLDGSGAAPADGRGHESASAKSRPRKSFKRMLIAGIVLTVAASGWWVSSLRAFRFLDGHRVTDHLESRAQRVEYYRFKGDFNDVYAEAGAELVARGFSEHNRKGPITWGSPPNRRRETRFSRKGGEWESVRIKWLELHGEIEVQVILPRRPRFRERLRRLIWRVKNRKVRSN